MPPKSKLKNNPSSNPSSLQHGDSADVPTNQPGRRGRKKKVVKERDTDRSQQNNSNDIQQEPQEQEEGMSQDEFLDVVRKAIRIEHGKTMEAIDDLRKSLDKKIHDFENGLDARIRVVVNNEVQKILKPILVNLSKPRDRESDHESDNDEETEFVGNNENVHAQTITSNKINLLQFGLTRFNGKPEESVKPWVEDFKSLVSGLGFSELELIQLLKRHLGDGARRFVDQLDIHVTDTLDKTCRELIKMFHIEKSAVDIRNELVRLRYKRDEPIRLFAQRVRQLVLQAYAGNGLTTELIEELTFDYFRGALPQDLSSKVDSRNALTLESAISATEYESISKSN